MGRGAFGFTGHREEHSQLGRRENVEGDGARQKIPEYIGRKGDISS